MTSRKVNLCSILSVLLMILLSNGILAQKKNDEKEYTGTPVLWHEPTDLESRDLFLGAGGESGKHDIRKITFIEEKKGGYSTKYRVRDASGNEWIAKLGKEAQPDTTANRLLWAIGYETEIAYLFPHLTIGEKG